MRGLDRLCEFRILQILLFDYVPALFSQYFNSLNLIVRYLILSQPILRIKYASDNTLVLRIQAQLSVAQAATPLDIDFPDFCDLVHNLWDLGVLVYSERNADRLIIHHGLDLLLNSVLRGVTFNLNWSSDHLGRLVYLVIWNRDAMGEGDSRHSHCILGCVVRAERICFLKCILVENFP